MFPFDFFVLQEEKGGVKQRRNLLGFSGSSMSSFLDSYKLEKATEITLKKKQENVPDFDTGGSLRSSRPCSPCHGTFKNRYVIKFTCSL